MTLMTRKETSSQALCDTLHRALSQTGAGHCWLLIDPCLRPLQSDDELAQRLRIAGRKTLAANCPDRRIPTSDQPLLIPLDSTRSADSAVLGASMDEALAELEADELVHGRGRRIAGWLQSSAPADVLARHIGRQMIQHRPNGKTTLFHWVDPAALWAFWPVLDTPQQATLLGPIQSYRLLDPSGHLTMLGGTGREGHPVDGPLDLSPAQWADADAIGALNTALRDWGADRAEPRSLAAAREAGADALRRARARGYTRTADLTAYASRAISIDARFDAHPLVSQRLDAAEPDAYLNAVLDDLTPSDWQRIRLNALDPLRA